MALIDQKAWDKGFAPTSSYLRPSKIQEGKDIRFTILGEDSCTGYEVWFEKGRGVFATEPTEEEILERAKEMNTHVKRDGSFPKFFTAFSVWNYEEEKVQVFEFSQKSIAEPLSKALTTEEIQAEPHLTDFVISVKGALKSQERKFNVICLSGRRTKPALNAPIEEAWEEAKKRGFNIKVINSGGNPFKGTIS